MRCETILAAIGAVLTASALLSTPAPAATVSPQEQVERGLMCFCGCTDLTVKVCNCGTAARIKEDVAGRLSSGATVEQVIAAYVAQYGEQIRSAPDKKGFNLLAWTIPFAAIAVAGLFILAFVRRAGARTGAPIPAAAGPAATTSRSGADRKILERIEHDIREGF
jgi:cytochrome c-type biogenesis protein CcmH/NrfF